MIRIPTAPALHTVFDVAAWLSASAAAAWQHRRWPRATQALAGQTAPSYFVWLALGAVAGAWLAGTLNTARAGLFAPSHSVAGALAGGIVAVELWKVRHRVRAATGGGFVLPLATGMAVGRLGCLFAGLADFTYGVPTSLPWAVDLGDGIGRQPVQLYEALAMAGFALAFARARLRGARWTGSHGFHVLAIFYGGQRFAWEFLKPYPALVGPLNLFHLLSLGLIAYGVVWIGRGDRGQG